MTANQDIADIARSLNEELHRRVEHLNLDARFKGDVVGHLLELLSEANADGSPAPFSSAIGAHVALKVVKYIKGIEAVHAHLVKHACTEAKPLELGGGDEVGFVLADEPDMLVFALTRQTVKFIVVLEHSVGDVRIHLRRYWDEFKEAPNGDRYDGFRLTEAAGKSLGLSDLVKFADAAAGYSDYPRRLTYPKRPSLQYFKNRQFDVRGDSAGYFVSVSTHHRPQTSGTPADIPFAFLDLCLTHLQCVIEDLAPELEIG